MQPLPSVNSLNPYNSPIGLYCQLHVTDGDTYPQRDWVAYLSFQKQSRYLGLSKSRPGTGLGAIGYTKEIHHL